MRLIRLTLLPLALWAATCTLVSAQADFVKPDTPPVPVRTPPPHFPNELKGTAGVVTIAVVIDENGSVTSAEVNKSSHPGFEAPSLAAVAKWRFTPAMKDSRPVSSRVILPLHFRED